MVDFQGHKSQPHHRITELPAEKELCETLSICSIKKTNFSCDRQTVSSTTLLWTRESFCYTGYINIYIYITYIYIYITYICIYIYIYTINPTHGNPCDSRNLHRSCQLQSCVSWCPSSNQWKWGKLTTPGKFKLQLKLPWGLTERPGTLWWTNSLQWKMAIEIVDFPIKNSDFPWQNVSSPEGISYA